MKRIAAIGIALSLCGCGGGGGGIASTPPPTTGTGTPTPTPVNSSITNLQVSQSFTNDAAATEVTFNTTSKTTVSAKGAAVPLTVRYDAASGSYAVTGNGVTDTFTAADRQGTATGETRYVRRTGNDAVYLTLVTTPYYGSAPNQYVGLGYWQRNTLSGERQNTTFTTFAYGLDTPASGVPRAGSGTFNTDVFGLETVPGNEPNVFQGRGRFDVDFQNVQFSTQTYVTRTGLISGNGAVGGGLDLTGGGRLSSANGSFSGEIVYRSSNVGIGGQLSGRFYGPNAQEIGASFAGAASDGSAFNGSLTGQRDTTLNAANISFDRLVTQQLFYADATTLSVYTPRNGSTPYITDYPGSIGSGVSRSQFTDKTSGNVSFGPPTSNMAGGEYTVTSIVAGDANFTTYNRTIADQPTQLELYKTGSANKELALTYASFGRYATSRNDDPFQSEVDRVFFVYGFNTPDGLFANRTGSANYAGVVYGAGAEASGALVDVTGTTRMSVDFGSQSLSGTLALTGRKSAGTVDYGSFGFAGKLFAYGSTSTASIARAGGASTGAMLINFYGPAADEAAGIFRVRVPDGAGVNTLINGALVAKKQ